jgi:ribosomal protein S18 acetylase RimI-like enzyme
MVLDDSCPEDEARAVIAVSLLDVVATVSGRLAGAIRVQAKSDVTGELGMLAADPEHRGVGVGRQLIAFAERIGRAGGLQCQFVIYEKSLA